MDAEALARRARAGDREALRELCACYYPRLCRYLYHMTHSRMEAEDLAQETLLGMIGGLERYRKWPGAGFEGWLFRIAHNKYLSQARREKPGPLPQGFDPPDPAPSPEQVVIHEEQRQKLEAALGKLDAPQRELVVLRYQMDMGHRQIGEALQMSPAQVKWRLHDAMEKLRRLMKEGEDAP